LRNNQPRRKRDEDTIKTIGLIGGTSWESSLDYYRLFNEMTRDKLGGFHSAPIIMHSVDFAPYELWMRTNRWDRIAEEITVAARSLQTAGAEMVLLCTNSMHKVADQIESALAIPFLHIADAAGQAVRDAGISKIGLLGTRFTMEEDFYSSRLMKRYGITALIPEKDDRDEVHRVIFEELVQGKINEQSKARYFEIVNKLSEQGAKGIILGCTEIGMLIHQTDTPTPLFDTTTLHVRMAMEFALK
jgi:aspartate racemase